MKHYLDNSATLTDMQLPPMYNPNHTPDGPSGNIVIADGQVFEVDSLLEMLPGASILVEPGGKLLVKATITGACGQMWQGVVLRGDPSVSHDKLDKQSYVHVYPNGKLEHAHCAIDAQYVDTNGTPVMGTGGGFVKVTSSSLENNTIGVRFGAWSGANKSILFNTDFTVNDDYRGSGKRPVFVDIGAIRGLWVWNCNFKDQRSTCDTTLAIGIDSKGGGYDVESCDFENLYIGIKGDQLSVSAGSFYIKNCDFTNCYTGIYANLCSSFSMKGNEFTVGKPSKCAADSIDVIGARISGNTVGFSFKENIFYGDSTHTQEETLIGADFNDTGEGMGNIVLENTFSGLMNGNRARKYNGGGTGLLYLCNTNNNNLYDFFVTENGTIQTEQKDIDPNNLADLPTENILSKYLYDFYNYGPVTVQYFYDSLYSDNQKPDTSFAISFGVNPVRLNVRNERCIETDTCDTCPETWGDNFFTNQQNWLIRKANAEYMIDSQLIAAEWDTIYALRKLMNEDANRLLLYYNLDSLAFDVDSILTWLARANTLPSDLQLASHYFFSGEFDEFDTLWADIPSKHELTVEQDDILGEMTLVYGIVRPHLEGDGQLYNLSPAIIDSLLFWKDWCSEPGFLAHSLLWRNGIETNPDCKSVQSRAVIEEKETVAKAYPNSFRFYPNPASQSVTLELPPGTGEVHVSIYNLQGRLVVNQVFEDAPIKSDLSISFLPTGIYFITAQSPGKQLGQGMLFVQQ
jgi:hypothetical protein